MVQLGHVQAKHCWKLLTRPPGVTWKETLTRPLESLWMPSTRPLNEKKVTLVNAFVYIFQLK